MPYSQLASPTRSHRLSGWRHHFETHRKCRRSQSSSPLASRGLSTTSNSAGLTSGFGFDRQKFYRGSPLRRRGKRLLRGSPKGAPRPTRNRESKSIMTNPMTLTSSLPPREARGFSGRSWQPTRRWLHHPLHTAARVCIQLYRCILSPAKYVLFGPAAGCRFYPSCSAYALEAIEIHGLFHGGWISLRRLCRCHPWGGQGVDPVPVCSRAQLRSHSSTVHH